MNIEEARKKYKRLSKVLKDWEKQYKKMDTSEHKSKMYYLILDLEKELFTMRSNYGESNLEGGERS